MNEREKISDSNLMPYISSLKVQGGFQRKEIEIMLSWTRYTFEQISKYSIGKFSLLHSILWNTNIICFDLLGLSSNFPASQTQLAATLCEHKQAGLLVN